MFVHGFASVVSLYRIILRLVVEVALAAEELTLVHSAHEFENFDHTVAKSPFVIIPCADVDEGASDDFCAVWIKNARVRVFDDVGEDERVV